LTSCSCCILTGLLFWSCHFEIPLCSEVGICTTKKRFFFLPNQSNQGRSPIYLFHSNFNRDTKFICVLNVQVSVIFDMLLSRYLCGGIYRKHDIFVTEIL